MIAAVCCPGPSLPATWGTGRQYATTIAVNRALLVVTADWLSAADVGLYQGLLNDARPRIGCLTSLDTSRFMDATWGKVATWEGSALIQEHQAMRPVQWSVQAALCYAVELGARHIDLFGCDGGRHGPIDCTGYGGENRGPDRWAREEVDLAATFELLRGKGISIERI